MNKNNTTLNGKPSTKLKVCGLKKEKTWCEKLFLPSFVLGCCYIIWRLIFTIDYSTPFNIIAGYLLWVAELYSFIMFLSFSYLTSQKCDCGCDFVDSDDFYEEENLICSIDSKTNNMSCNPKASPSVDVFICTYNEGMDILLDTFEGCKNIDYPLKEVYVLDDGKRDKVKQVASEFGFKYITRDNNIGYKAGNINNALSQTDGELIVIFDADHIPVSNFLRETVDYFMDNQVAIVQTPQHFYNPDPIQKNLRMYKTLCNEQDLFFRVLEPSISCSNSTLVAGTNFIVKRKFLEEIGGLPSESITEDTALGLKLQERGLKVYFSNTPLAAGLAPENYKEYLVQRCRWAKGTIQIFLNKTLGEYLSNMEWNQKIPYYAGLVYYLLSLPRLICICAPAVFIIWGIRPIIANFWPTLFLFQLSYFSIKILYFKLSASKYRNILFSDLYELCLWYPLLTEITGMFLTPQGTKKQKFSVTNKGKLVNTKKCELSTILPNIVLLLFCLVSYIFIIPRYAMIDYKPALYVNVFWNTYNCIMLALAVSVGIEKPDKRELSRFLVNIRSTINDNALVKSKIHNLSKTGAQIITKLPLEVDSIIVLDIHELKGINAKVRYSKIIDNKVYSGVSFINPKDEFKKEIFKLIFNNSKSW